MCVVLMLVAATTSGCGGCTPLADEKLTREELEKRAKEQKEAIVYTSFLTLPSDTETRILNVKPGHWVETSRTLKSNREDLQIIATGDVIRGADRTLTVPGTNITAEFARPTVLPKGQQKSIDLQYFVPTSSAVVIDPSKGESNVLKLRSSILSRNLLTPIIEEPFSANELKHHEYQLVVASPKPLEYRYLSASDLILWKGEGMMFEERTRSYQLILCESTDGKISLPHSLFAMTAMAVLIWDDVPPDDLSEDQQQALLDWVTWGGQLVISGPSSWSRLQNSFLSPYLPVSSGEVAELGTEDFAEISKKWVVDDITGRGRDPLEIIGSKVPGLRFKLSSSGSWLPNSGELAAERILGRGRIVLTGFPLREQRIARWKYFVNFFSTGLLRRPPRTIRKNDLGWEQVWDSPYSDMENDPRLNSFLRITSRDLPLSLTSNKMNPEFAAQNAKEISDRLVGPSRLIGEPEKTPKAPRQFTDSAAEAVLWSPNGAAWSDTSGLTLQALTTLRRAAGIVLPDRWTIIYLLAGYLAILVPINWLVFKILGRLEYAWVAAPIIALVGVVVVTRVARLDIGFARRGTQIGLLEVYGDYPRAHLTNYMALYTSLSTNYSLEFPERGSVALPLGDMSRRTLRAGSVTPKVTANYGSSEGIRLEPLTVYSNSTEMLHCEQMIDLKGSVEFQADPDSNQVALKNSTRLSIKSSLVFRKTDTGQIEYAWVGDLDAGQVKRVQFIAASTDTFWKHWNTNPATRRPSDTDTEPDEPSPSQSEDGSALLVGGIIEEMVQAVPLVEGQTRLIGYADDQLSEQTIEPSNDQFDSRMVVLVHLTPANLGPVTPDRRIMSVVTGQVDSGSAAEDKDPPSF